MAGRDSEPCPEPRFTVSAVARRLGVAPATLRTWDRRYGPGPTLHRTGSHRRYTAGDVARLEVMRRLVLDGVPPADAARLATSGRPHAALPPFLQPAVQPASHAAGYQASPGPSGRLDLGGAILEPLVLAARPPRGGRGLALPGAGPALRGLARAALALDAEEIRAALARSLSSRGVVWTWNELLRPLLVAVGLRWEATGRYIETEHLLCEATLAALYSAVTPRRPTVGRPALLAAAPHERHSLPLVVLAAALAEHRIDVRTLGEGLPADALRTAVRRSGPAALLLWSQRSDTADPAVLASLPVTRPPTTLLAGGAGWEDRTLPARVTYVPDLDSVVRLIRIAVGA